MKKQNKRVVIKCTENQAVLIEICLDCFSRMAAGQMDRLIDGLNYVANKSFKVHEKEYYALSAYIKQILKPLLFPELDDNASYGVGMKQIGRGQIAYEMVKKLQNFRTRNSNDAGVLAHEPLHYSKEPLIEVSEERV